ncbi:ferredoxin [Mycobacterium sp. GA-2829]|uniref:ferredoxin n=1 Tax=Mycobacterium sp. GA-2829 TaxID=1772283 RepID=UPI00073FCAB9|nr:ferredoxin [Mycobacterium sp. GA-2829]KUI29005.1 ferredoxin [Mycobacterium sp. GA-2829]
MRIRLDRTMCDGFGICAKHAPEYFSLDDWGYASLIGNGTVPEADQPAVRRALLDCPVHAIIEMHEGEPLHDRPSQPPAGAASVDDAANGDHAAAVREEHMLPGL